MELTRCPGALEANQVTNQDDEVQLKDLQDCLCIVEPGANLDPESMTIMPK